MHPEPEGSGEMPLRYKENGNEERAVGRAYGPEKPGGVQEKAKALIMSGIVYVNGQKEDKAGTSFEETVQIEVREAPLNMSAGEGLSWKRP